LAVAHPADISQGLPDAHVTVKPLTPKSKSGNRDRGSYARGWASYCWAGDSERFGITNPNNQEETIWDEKPSNQNRENI
jgi:hypothetical protein